MQGNASALTDWMALLLSSPPFGSPILGPAKPAHGAGLPHAAAASGTALLGSAGAASRRQTKSEAASKPMSEHETASPATSRRSKTVTAPAGDDRHAPHAPPREDAAARENALLLDYVDGVAGGDETALAKLYDVTVGRVYGVALRIVRQPESAEEVVTDVYMQVWKDASRYDASRGKVLGWLLIIARTRSLDLLRRADEAFSHPDPHTLADEPEDSRQSPQDLLLAARDNGALHAALQVLSPLQRQLLSLAFFKGLSHSEIVEHAGLPLGSVKTHIRRALAELRNVLEIDPAFTR
jgi:RNA polymerase sigma factor (sigma-70 family)